MILFGTKSETLERLGTEIKSAKVLDLVRVTYGMWDERTLNAALSEKKWTTMKLVVRSSASCEDGLDHSNAGRFKSVVGVVGVSAVATAVRRVFESYGKSVAAGDEVFIQPHLQNVSMAGVVMTANIDDFSQYYIINYDESGSTDSVTKGDRGNLNCFVCFKDAWAQVEGLRMQRVIKTCREVEGLFGNDAIDIEFALNDLGELYVFQVRPIVRLNKRQIPDYVNLSLALDKLNQRIENRQNDHPYLLGSRSIYGVMPDWNPAEIIGLKPRQLAFSLYRELVTDQIWAYQRSNYGYRDLRSHPLLLSFMGMPYVDVRVSFNSFIPKELPDSIAGKLVDYYIEKLQRFPHFHDKIEFEIVHSCYYLNLSSRLSELVDFGFCEGEIESIEQSLLQLTNSIIDPSVGLFRQDMKKIELLIGRCSSLETYHPDSLEKIYWLVEEIKRYGTLPFAGIARAAFVAVQFLQSFVDLEIMTSEELDSFMLSLNSVSTSLREDLYNVHIGKMSRKEFLSSYGHLRPGTYDILSPRYDERFDEYFGGEMDKVARESSFVFSEEQIDDIEAHLRQSGIASNARELIRFIVEAIEGREYAKFVFTRPLSELLRCVGRFCENQGIDLFDAANLDIHLLMDCYTSIDYRSIESLMKKNIEDNIKSYEYTKAVKLPNTIMSASDVYSYAKSLEQPNYVVANSVEAEVLNFEPGFELQLEGRIVFIESADPGYDFIFSNGILGLITKFGGANSHMAVRCAELGLPAVIGAGERNYNLWSKARRLHIDSVSRQVRIIA